MSIMQSNGRILHLSWLVQSLLLGVHSKNERLWSYCLSSFVKRNFVINVVIDFEISNLLVRSSPKFSLVRSALCSLGDHYSELSVLGCKYRFYPDQPFKRRLIRGSILCGKVLAAPVLLCMAVVAGAVFASVGLPAYCCVMLVRHIKVTWNSLREKEIWSDRSFHSGKTTTTAPCETEGTDFDEL